MRARTRLPAILVAAGLTAAAGCEPGSVNRSPTPDQDPDRYARAREEDRRVLAEAKAAEARFFRQLGQPPGELDEPEAIASSDSEHRTP